MPHKYRGSLPPLRFADDRRTGFNFMTPEEQRIAIAQECGWEFDDEGLALTPDGKTVDRNLALSTRLIPDYLNDLNAMHDAEDILLFSRRQRFYDALKNVMSKHMRSKIADIECCRATAAQRAEAFLVASDLLCT